MFTKKLASLCNLLKLNAIKEYIGPVFKKYGIDINQAMLALEELFGYQVQENDIAKQLRSRKAAQLRFPNSMLENIDFGLKKGLNPAIVKRLAKGDWVKECAHLIFIGPTGTMKTTLACAFANALIVRGYKVRFYTLFDLLEALKIEDDKEDRNYLKRFLRKLKSIDVLVIDDWALFPLKTSQRRLLFEVIQQREDKGSLIITSQYPPNKWHEAIGDGTTADAVLDRIVHCSNTFNFSDEESVRKLLGQKNGGVYVKH
ncbi:ATP-binding protein [Pseudoalteromonas sp. JSTW]|uniref:ATP-binding protein n=1 Tax=Pseudoalteromonas sp. JSTW TaxID=2752475 RepID=UPI0015D55B5D|nr:ATP-binding protein [Pseudoalteromonas sp. JSTW]QLJ07238.1 ATP-binding protein [Pseudoalteromonas sp. JSTW]